MNKITADYLFTVWARKNKKLFYGTSNTDRDVEQICASAFLTSVLSADVNALTLVLCPDSPIYVPPLEKFSSTKQVLLKMFPTSICSLWLHSPVQWGVQQRRVRGSQIPQPTGVW